MTKHPFQPLHVDEHGTVWTVEEVNGGYIIGGPDNEVRAAFANGRQAAVHVAMLLEELDRLRGQRDALLAACKWVGSWLFSFSVPPTSTVAEKEQAVRVIEDAVKQTEAHP